MCHQLDKCCRFFYFYCGTLQTILQSMNYIILMLDELKPHYYLLSIKESFIRLASRVCPLITCKNILFLVALLLSGSVPSNLASSSPMRDVVQKVLSVGIS